MMLYYYRFQPATYGCICGRHWSGPQCNEDVDECDEVTISRCGAHGACVNTPVCSILFHIP